VNAQPRSLGLVSVEAQQVHRPGPGIPPFNRTNAKGFDVGNGELAHGAWPRRQDDLRRLDVGQGLAAGDASTLNRYTSPIPGILSWSATDA